MSSHHHQRTLLSPPSSDDSDDQYYDDQVELFESHIRLVNAAAAARPTDLSHASASIRMPPRPSLVQSYQHLPLAAAAVQSQQQQQGSIFQTRLQTVQDMLARSQTASTLPASALSNIATSHALFSSCAIFSSSTVQLASPQNPASLILSGCVLCIAQSCFLGSVGTLSGNQALDTDIRNTLIKNCQLLGAHVVARVEDCDVFLTPVQLGADFELALSLGKNIVNLQWLDDCIHAKRLVSPTLKPLIYSPLKSMEGIPEMRGLVISVTGFVGEERNDLKYLVRACGAIYSGALQRKENTHLVCHVPEGEKFKKAIEWHITCVNARWLHDCLMKWTRMPEWLYSDVAVNR